MLPRHALAASTLLTSAPADPPPSRGHLLLETSLVSGAALVILAGVARLGPTWPGSWLAPSAVLLAAALLPTLLQRRSLAQLGLRHSRDLASSLVWFALTALVVLAGVVLALSTLHYLRLQPPLVPNVPRAQWPPWLAFQLLYVAPAEELFFRGYLTTNLLHLCAPLFPARAGWQRWAAIAGSAAAFTLAHVAVSGAALSALTFLPGLILGWLFVRTRCLLAPVLLHAFANAAWAWAPCLASGWSVP